MTIRKRGGFFEVLENGVVVSRHFKFWHANFYVLMETGAALLRSQCELGEV